MKDMRKYRIIAHVKTARCYVICDLYLYAKNGMDAIFIAKEEFNVEGADIVAVSPFYGPIFADNFTDKGIVVQ